MPTQTQASVADPEVLSPQWLYDTLMEVIEPDLVSKNIGHLDEKYANETSDERSIRMRKYAEAFRIYNEALEEIKDEFIEDAEYLKSVCSIISAQEKDEHLLGDAQYLYSQSEK